MSKIYEWQGRLDGLMLSVDTAAAFDNCPVIAVSHAMREAGIPLKPERVISSSDAA